MLLELPSTPTTLYSNKDLSNVSNTRLDSVAALLDKKAVVFVWRAYADQLD